MGWFNLPNRRLNIILGLAFILLLLINIMLGFYWYQASKNARQTSNLTLINQVKRSGNQEKLPIWGEYVINSITGEKIAVLQGKLGEAKLINNPEVHLFFAEPRGGTPASFSDLSVGQKIKVAVFPNRNELWIYIVN